MNEYQRLFLVQARTDFAVLGLLRRQPDVPPCHALHYLQMATEMLGKAFAWRRGKRHRPKKSHRAFVAFLRSLTTNRQAQKRLDYDGQNELWRENIRTSIRLAEAIEDLAPSLAGDGPNPEYPWREADPQIAPAEHTFAIWHELQTSAGRQFLHFLSRLFAAADAFF